VRNSFSKSLLLAAQKNAEIVLLTGDLGYSVFEEFANELPNQFFNLGITEQSSMSFAAGLAKEGLRPFYYSIANFPTFRCFEQIRNDVVHMNLPVTIVAVGAGFSYGSAGYSHHLVEDLSGLRSLSGLDIYSPHDPIDTAACLKQILSGPNPSYLRIGRGGDPNLEGHLRLEDLPHNLNESDGTIFFTGSIGVEVLKAKEDLRRKGIDINAVSISNLSRINPVTLKKVVGEKPFLTVEEHVLQGGFGSALIEVLGSFEKIPPYKRLGVSRIDGSLVGSTDFLRKVHGIHCEAIVRNFNELVRIR
jgi:transketolase